MLRFVSGDRELRRVGLASAGFHAAGCAVAIEPQPFIDAVTGHSASAGVAARLVRERLSRRPARRRR